MREKRPEKNEQKLELDRAEFLLRQGLDEDEAGNEEEAIELYLQAAELCLKAVSIYFPFLCLKINQILWINSIMYVYCHKINLCSRFAVL